MGFSERNTPHRGSYYEDDESVHSIASIVFVKLRVASA